MKYFYKATCITIRIFKENDSLQFLAHRKISLKASLRVFLYTLSNLKSFFETNKIFVCDRGKMKKKKSVYTGCVCTLTLILHRMVLSESVIFKKDASLKYFPEDNIFFLFLLFRHLHFAFPLNYATRFTRKNAIYNLGRQF